jgi:hypothetical protein
MMAHISQDNNLGRGLRPGDRHYRAFVGPPEKYDLVGAMQFNLLAFLGLREVHSLLDIGCGSLRAGRLFISYLLPGHYFGIEPEQWLIEEGIRNECGKDLINIKSPVFSNDSNFTCTAFGQKFDFILAQSIFSHASQAQITRCLSQAKECMKPTSVFAATFLEGEENYVGSEWLYPSCSTYTMTRMVELAEEVGLICKAIDWPHPNQQTWVVIVYPEYEENIPDLSNVTRLLRLENELQFYKDKLAGLEKHPWVKFGLGMKRLLCRIGLSFR